MEKIYMFVRLVFMVIIFFIIIYILGKGLLIRLKGDMSVTNVVLMGFLLYYALFELLALPITLLQYSLTKLIWLWCLTIVMLCAFFILDRRFWKTNPYIHLNLLNGINKYSLFFMIFLFIVQSWFMLNLARSAWDIAYYIGGVNSSVYTDTLWIYDGSSGMKNEYLPIRYAITSFWTHDALLAKLFSIHGAVVCRCFNSLILSILSTLTVFSMAKEVFEDRNSCCITVIFWMIANMGITDIYHQNNFFFLRAMENKSYCCNLLIPLIIVLVLRIWKNSNESSNWVCLFIANVAGVAVSGTAMVLIPVLVGCCLCGQWLYTRKSIDFWRTVVCLMPCIVYIMIYVGSTMGMRITINV